MVKFYFRLGISTISDGMDSDIKYITDHLNKTELLSFLKENRTYIKESKKYIIFGFNSKNNERVASMNFQKWIKEVFLSK